MRRLSIEAVRGRPMRVKRFCREDVGGPELDDGDVSGDVCGGGDMDDTVSGGEPTEEG